MSLLDEFLAELADNPDDWTLRGVLADWFEDDGRPELAECLRWMARRHKRPYHGQAAGQTVTASWFNGDALKGLLGDPESDLPGELFLLLEGGKGVANHKSFPSLSHAEQAIQHAWVRARAGGWEPIESA